MKITNLDSIKTLLAGEAKAKTSMLSKPLEIIYVGDDYITVASSRDADLSIKLRGITGISVGSTVTVDAKTGEVTVVTAAPGAAPAKQKATSQGCREGFQLVR